MSGDGIRVRTSIEGDIAAIKALIEHPMESGLRKDSASGKFVPAHYIEEFLCEHRDRLVMKVRCSPMIAKNPYLAFRFRGARSGDPMRIRWRDNFGATGEHRFTL